MSNTHHRYFKFGPYSIDTEAHLLLRNREVVSLGEAYRPILSALVRGKGKIFSKDELQDIGWGNVHVEKNSVYKSIESIRKALGPGGREYILNVPRRGYRFVADLEELSEESWKRISEAPRPPFENQFSAKEKPGIGVTNKIGDFIGLLLSSVGSIAVQRPSAKIAILMAMALGINLLLPMTATERQENRVFSVIADAMILAPINGVNGNDDQIVANRITEKVTAEIETDLSAVEPGVNSETGASRFGSPQKDLSKPRNSPQPAALFSGTVEILKDTVLVKVNLKRLPDNVIIWEATIEESMRDLETKITSIAKRISREVVEALARVHTYIEPANPSPPAPTSVDYSEGDRYLAKRTPGSIKKSIDAFHRAINKDPSDALAYANLADAYILIGGVGYNEMPPEEAFPKAKEAATKALELNRNLPEARAAMAMVKLFYDYDFVEADREFRRAIYLSLKREDEDPVARHWYANFLTLVGRFDESLAQIKRARELDPSSPIINATIGWTHYFARDYDQAIKECKKALELHEDFYVTHAFVGFAYAQKGMFKDAIRELTRAKELSQNSPVMIAELGRVQALSGNKSEAYKALNELQALSTQRYVSPYSVAMVYVGLGDKDTAFEWLYKAFDEHSGWLIHMKVEPALDSLRTDNRFGKLLKRVGLSN